MSDNIATRKAYGEALVELGRANPDVVVLEADLSKSTMSALFAKEFPDRFFNFGVAEADMIGAAAGFAVSGKIPFASSFAVFCTGRAWEQVRLVVGYAQTNVKIGGSHAGITVGEDGASHQMNEDLALMRAIPGMTILVPADAVEMKLAVPAAAALKGPVYIRLGRMPVPVLFDGDYRFEIGRAAKLREGKDVALIGCGIMVDACLQAADILKEKADWSATVINMSTIKPLDRAAVVDAARTCGRVVTAEEHSIIGGLGSAVAEVLGEECPTSMARIGLKDCFGESGKPAELLEKYEMNPQDIAEAALGLS
ncbi:MAG: transketolase family protein [Armatimonadetes bacterium]|nr:transketolase family protein [Armatimonadota bacterium]NIM24841.1 transketolase family protein [Armatimonadota bacterium]NIM68731.1 transketolase family protein [Armatimonadota bacterium]NIM76024.1 transketolase family protein [Armatimonadota bacterium]NIN06928.1 transketolase family protein [Armatimonadota bacterium]